jgi:hypothetical protein
LVLSGPSYFTFWISPKNPVLMLVLLGSYLFAVPNSCLRQGALAPVLSAPAT